jgi:hypothetical protein
VVGTAEEAAQMVKSNPYSDELKNALQAVADIKHPDYLMLPLDPTPEMLVAAGRTTGLAAEEIRKAYQAMVAAWSEVDDPGNNT